MADNISAAIKDLIFAVSREDPFAGDDASFHDDKRADIDRAAGVLDAMFRKAIEDAISDRLGSSR